jgi:hypothetical protein
MATATTIAPLKINTEEDDLLDELLRPYQPMESTKFTRRIADFKFPSKSKMPSNVGMYDGTGNPEDHLELFSGAAKVER